MHRAVRVPLALAARFGCPVVGEPGRRIGPRAHTRLVGLSLCASGSVVPLIAGAFGFITARVGLCVGEVVLDHDAPLSNRSRPSSEWCMTCQPNEPSSRGTGSVVGPQMQSPPSVSCSTRSLLG